MKNCVYYNVKQLEKICEKLDVIQCGKIRLWNAEKIHKTNVTVILLLKYNWSEITLFMQTS